MIMCAVDSNCLSLHTHTHWTSLYTCATRTRSWSMVCILALLPSIRWSILDCVSYLWVPLIINKHSIKIILRTYSTQTEKCIKLRVKDLLYRLGYNQFLSEWAAGMFLTYSELSVGYVTLYPSLCNCATRTRLRGSGLHTCRSSSNQVKHPWLHCDCCHSEVTAVNH